MIFETLTCFVDEVNEFFRSKLKVSDEKVVLSALVNQDGSVAIQGENKIVVSLISLEKESAITSTGRTSSGQPPLAVNLLILCSAYFSGNNYNEGLKFLSFIISFLQQKPVFTPSNTPRLNGGISKLMFELEPVGLERQSNIWSMLGAKYLPSVIYKVRMLTYDTDTNLEYRPGIRGLADNHHPIS